ncbi:MAG TPA: hypothetical protein VJX74_19310 [Blastocatellia bacterium]|nr:hypothetical protein [Blastocatellia bacterium]
MKRISCLIAIALAFSCSISQAQTFNALIGPFYYGPGNNTVAETHTNVERASPVARKPITRDFVLSKFDDHVVDKFRDAWRSSGNGTTTQESVLLILRMADGSYSARSMGATNEYKSFTFNWHPAAVAIVHTHPNSSSPKPQSADRQVADKFGVLMFTITSRGMYLYDPSTKKTTKVQDGLDWLESSSWAKVKAALKTE